jgi:polyribonucleotide nucleotidyltransferase
MDFKHVECELGGRKLTIETGRWAKQAGGAAVVRYGDTLVLVAATASKHDLDLDFLPLFVDYREKAYAAGKIPGGFFKREGRPADKETLTARLIDRSIRPFFPKGFARDIQVICQVLSVDQENDPDILCLLAASAALNLSNIPFPETVSAIRVGKKNGEMVVNPTFEDLDYSTMDLVVAGTDDSIVMVEGGAEQVTEDEIVDAFDFAAAHIRTLNGLQRQIREMAGREKFEWTPKAADTEVESAVREHATEPLRRANQNPVKEDRAAAMSEAMAATREAMAERFPDRDKDVKGVLQSIEKELVRSLILDDRRRVDGRAYEEVRAIDIEVGVLPRCHGSAIFQRGQTQALVVTTLGTSSDEQRIESLEGQSWKSYMLHYNFPPFSVGETRPMRGPGRREIGHGALAERALAPIIPQDEQFPYTLRLVSEILESNGSSSMASVCGGSLALMDAGVPIGAPVAGIAMGLVSDGSRTAVLTDIQGVEDHLGDMDFKVTGTRAGITALQMDNKIGGLSREVLVQALNQARDARIHILDAMERVIDKPRADLSAYAPRIEVLRIPPEKIGEVIGPGGRMIKKITEETGCQIDINDDGLVKIASSDVAAGRRAAEIISAITADPEIGRAYKGVVKRVVNFGAFVEILPGRDGLVHISELAPHRVNQVEDVVREGDEVVVKVIGVDDQGKIRLSRKACLAEVGGE